MLSYLLAMKIPLTAFALFFLLCLSCTQSDKTGARQSALQQPGQPATPGVPGTVVGVWIYTNQEPASTKRAGCKPVRENRICLYKRECPDSGQAGIHDLLYEAWRQHLETWAM